MRDGGKTHPDMRGSERSIACGMTLLVLVLLAGTALAQDDGLGTVSSPSGAGQGDAEQIDIDLAASLYRISWDALDRRSATIQTETPTMSSNSTSLADGSGVSEFVSIALNLSGLTGTSTNSSDPTSASSTITLLAIGKAVCGLASCSDSLDEKRRGRLVQNLRNVGLTLGYDGDNGSASRSILYGARWKLDGLWKSMPNDTPDGTAVDTESARANSRNSFLAKRLLGAAGEGASMAESGQPDDSVRRAVLLIQNNVWTGASEAAMRESASPAVRTAWTEESLRAHLRSASRGAGGRVGLGGQESAGLVDLRRAVETVVEATRRAENERWYDALSVALDFQGRDGQGGMLDMYSAKINMDYTPRNQNQATIRLNGGFVYNDVMGGPSTKGGDAALELLYRFTGDNKTAGRAPVEVSFAAMAKWLSNAQDQYVGQGKLTIPLFNGITLPLSVTVANRTELINETNVKGQIGFSVDSARLVELFKPGA